MAMPINFQVWALVCLLILVALAAVDSSYYHFHKFRLYAVRASRGEHLIHTLRAALLATAAVTFFDPMTCTSMFRVGAGVVLLDLAIQLWDMAIETQSRQHVGGLSRGEYVLHGVATMFHVAAICFTLSARAQPRQSDMVLSHQLCWAIGIALALSFIQHLYLLHPRYRRDAAGQLSYVA